MRIIIRDKGRDEVNIKIPNCLISMVLSIGPVAVKFDNNDNENSLNKEDLKAICKVAKEMAKDYKGLEIVNVISKDGSEVSIIV